MKGSINILPKVTSLSSSKPLTPIVISFRNDVLQNEITIGVKGFDEESDVTFGKMLIEPFTKND